MAGERDERSETHWLKINESVNEKLNTVKPFARSANGKISTVYETMRGVKAI